MSRLFHSVRFRLTLWYAAVFAVALTLFAVAVYLFVVRTLQYSIDEALKSYGHRVSGVAVHQSGGRPSPVKHVFVPSPSRHQAVPSILYVNPPKPARASKRGVTVPISTAPYYKIVVNRNRLPEGCNTVYPKVGRHQQRLPGMRVCFFNVGKAQKGKPAVGVEVVESLSGVDKTLERLRLALILGIPFALLLAGLGGWLLAGRALEPVDRITQMARSITATDLSRRINLRRQDELGRLAGTFDDMIDRLERAFQEQRQLAADVSHELRSPLTVLEAQTTLALRRSRGAEEYRQILVSVQEEVEHMAVMVNQLLTLARADAGEEEVVMEPVRLADVTVPVIDAMRPLAERKHVGCHLAADPDVWVQGDAGRLRQLVQNLVDNAIRHTHSGGRIDVQVEAVGPQAVLTVSDTGEGIAPQDLPHIFQRFYRGDRARQRGTGNSGLGLAIVQWIVEAHGGRVDVRSALGRGTAFTVALPLGAAAPLRERIAASSR